MNCTFGDILHKSIGVTHLEKLPMIPAMWRDWTHLSLILLAQNTYLQNIRLEY